MRVREFRTSRLVSDRIVVADFGVDGSIARARVDMGSGKEERNDRRGIKIRAEVAHKTDDFVYCIV